MNPQKLLMIVVLMIIVVGDVGATDGNDGGSGVSKDAARIIFREAFQRSIDSKLSVSPHAISLMGNCIGNDMANIIFHEGETWLDKNTFAKRSVSAEPLVEMMGTKCLSMTIFSMSDKQQDADRFDRSGIGRNAARNLLRERLQEALAKGNSSSGAKPHLGNCISDDMLGIIFHPGEAWLAADIYMKRISEVDPIVEILVSKCKSALADVAGQVQKSVDGGTTNNSGACDISTDETYGYTQENPIKVGKAGTTLPGKMNLQDALNTPITSSNGPARERAFLDTLLGPNGKKISYERRGSVRAGNTVLDRYVISGLGKEVILYLDMYSYAETKVPVGFTCLSAFHEREAATSGAVDKNTAATPYFQWKHLKQRGDN
jgi:hypothetical protein